MNNRLNNNTLGALQMISACVVFCLMSIMIKNLSHVDSFKIAMCRFVVGLGILSTAALWGKIKLEFGHGPFLFLRGLFGGTAVLIFYISIAKLGLGKASVVAHSFPIFAAIFSVILLKERLGLLKAAAILMSFFGIYLLTGYQSGANQFFSGFGKYEILAITGAVLAGLSVVLIKKLHDTDSSYTIFFAQCTIGLWIVIVPASTAESSIGLIDIAILLCIGLTATGGQLLMTTGYRHLPVSTGALIAMLVPVLNFFVGIIIFSEPLSLPSIIGAAIVVGACAVVLAGKDKQLRN